MKKILITLTVIFFTFTIVEAKDKKSCSELLQNQELKTTQVVQQLLLVEEELLKAKYALLEKAKEINAEKLKTLVKEIEETK